MDEQEEFSLEDIIEEFSDHTEAEQPDGMEEEPVQEETAPADAPEPVRTVSSDTIRLDTAQFAHVQTDLAQPVSEEPQEEAEPFSEEWEPEYDQPIAEYVPPRPILMHPRSRLKELKRKLTEGPERRYYQLVEQGLGKLQASIFFSILVVLISAIATAMYAFGAVQPERMKLMVFGQFFAMLVSALLGSSQLVEGLSHLAHRRFSLNALLVFTFALCCADGVICLRQQRVPCCAAFSLQVTMSLWASYEKRNIALGQMDTMRKATHLDGIAAVEDYYEGAAGLLRGQAQVEDFMDHWDRPSRLDKMLSIYALTAFICSIVLGIVSGVLHGVSMGVQVAAVATLAALPASIFVTLTRPMAVLERRLHGLGAVLCGWEGVEALNQKAVFPLDHEDLCPTGSVKLNGVKFYGGREPDEVVAYGAALICMGGGTLKPLFDHLLESRNGIRYEVADFRTYQDGGVGGEVNAEPVLVGTIAFLKEMGVEVPPGIRVSHAVGVSVDGELCGLFAITYDKVRSCAAGLATLSGYRGLRPVLITEDFMMTDTFIRDKFGVNPKRIVFPEQDVREALRQRAAAEEDMPALAISTGQGLAPFAYCVTGARALRTASRAGVIVHMVGGILGLVMMLVLAILGRGDLFTPANMFLYELIWMIPGLLITEWTRSV